MNDEETIHEALESLASLYPPQSQRDWNEALRALDSLTAENARLRAILTAIASHDIDDPQCGYECMLMTVNEVRIALNTSEA